MEASCGGVSCCGALALGCPGFSSCGFRPLRHSSCGPWAYLFPGMWDLPSPGMEPCITCIGRREDSLPLSHLGSTDNGVAGIVKVTECCQAFCCQRDSHSTNKPLALLLHIERDHCWLSSLVPSSAIRQDPINHPDR